jgi:hypothetical protein
MISPVDFITVLPLLAISLISYVYLVYITFKLKHSFSKALLRFWLKLICLISILRTAAFTYVNFRVMTHSNFEDSQYFLESLDSLIIIDKLVLSIPPISMLFRVIEERLIISELSGNATLAIFASFFLVFSTIGSLVYTAPIMAILHRRQSRKLAE